jgi:hypothetical protein
VVFADLNGNGVLDAGEPSTTTSATGQYTLTTTSTASVLTVLPARWYATGSATTEQGNSTTTVNLGEALGMVVSGIVYSDSNVNGQRDSGEPGLAGVTIYQDLNYNGVQDATDPSTTTASDGSYSLTIQPTTKYAPEIVVKPLTGYVAEETGTSFGFSQGSTLQYNVGFANQSYVTGFVSQYLGNNTDTSFDGATVYADLNNDGALDSGDVSTVSPNGQFYLGGLPQGTVTIRVVVPNGYAVYNGTGATQVTVGTLTKSTVYFYLQSISTTQTVSGTVYNDANDNGVVDQGETGISGVSVYIDSNNDGILDDGEESTTTDANGNYSLTETTLGTYNVRVIAPTGDTQTLPSGGQSISAALTTANQTLSGQNFAVAPAGSGGIVSGYVFTDYDGTGSTADTNSYSGIVGITVYDDLNDNGKLDPGEPYTTSMSSTGYYSLSVAGETQDVRVVVPSGYVATDSLGGEEQVSAPATNVNFPLFQSMEFKGIVYNDANGDGRQDFNETGLAGVLVFIDANNDGIYDTGDPSVLTDSSGLYDFTGIMPVKGRTQYDVYYVPPSGYLSQYRESGVGYFSGDVLSQRVGQASESYAEGSVQQTINGYNYGVAGVTVYADLNNDGILDAGDISTTTSIYGTYQLGNLPVGTDTIRTIVPLGYSVLSGNTSQSINVNPLTQVSPVTLYLATSSQAIGSIEGTVYQDSNDNGTDDLNELPIAGRTVYLDLNNDGVLDNGEPSVQTDASGTYLFTNLSAGAYTVREVLPAGVIQTSPGSNAPQVAVLQTYNGFTGSYALNGFGNLAVSGSINGNIFYDANGDGTQDNGEQNLSTQVAYIDANNDGVYDTGDTLAAATATGFSFSNLSAGTYVLRQILPTGFQQTLPANNAGISVTVVAGQTSTITFGADNPSPTAVITGVTTVAEGSSINLSAASSTETGGKISSFNWDLNYNGTFISNATGASAVFSAAALDGPSTSEVALLVTDAAGNTSLTSESITITNVAPTAVFSGSTITQGAAGTVTFTNPYDPSTADTAAGFTYSYDFNDDGTYDLVTTTPTATVPASYLTTTGAHTIAGKITDKDGGYTTYTTTVQVNAATNTAAKLTGTVIGTSGSYQNDGNTIAKAVDGNLATFFDGPSANGNWVGLGLGSAKVITSIAYASRSGWASRMNGGIFQASNSSTFASGVVNLYTIASNANPSSLALTTQTVSNTNGYRYVRYLSPANSYGDVAEIQFFGKAYTGLVQFTGTTIGTSGSYQNDGNTISKAVDGNLSTFFDGPTANGNWVGLDLGSAQVIKQISYAPRSGWASRMVGGIFQASNSATFSSGVVNLYTITAAPTQGVLTTVSVNVTAGYRYVRYLSPSGSFGDIAELAFFG